jgi:hypothetical protein
MSEPRISQAHTVFSMSCRVDVHIQAKAERVWSLLTDAKNFPRWNSTITIEGQIREGERLRLHVPARKRTFTPTVSGVVANERMTWTGGLAPVFKGVRTFELKPKRDGSTDFAMEERFSGLMLPLAKRAMPNFGPVFTTYANDLKRAAERAEKYVTSTVARTTSVRSRRSSVAMDCHSCSAAALSVTPQLDRNKACYRSTDSRRSSKTRARSLRPSAWMLGRAPGSRNGGARSKRWAMSQPPRAE